MAMWKINCGMCGQWKGDKSNGTDAKREVIETKFERLIKNSFLKDLCAMSRSLDFILEAIKPRKNITKLIAVLWANWKQEKQG